MVVGGGAASERLLRGARAWESASWPTCLYFGVGGLSGAAASVAGGVLRPPLLPRASGSQPQTLKAGPRCVRLAELARKLSLQWEGVLGRAAGGKGSSSQAWWDGQWHLGTRQGGGLLATLALDPGLAGAPRWVCGHWTMRAEVLWLHQGCPPFGTLMGKGGGESSASECGHQKGQVGMG